MPYAIASATKRNLRQGVSFRAGDHWPLTTSSAGNAGGTTAVFASLIGQPASSIVNRYLLLNSGSNAGEWRRISSFAPSTGAITVVRAYTAEVAISVTAELHNIRPDLFTLAGNEAIYKVLDMVYREVVGFIIPNGNDWHGMPRNMRTVSRILRLGSQAIKDLFDRADSTTTAGADWTATTGTWGTIGERLYSATDADADFITRDAALKDGLILAVVRGTTNHDSVYRTLSLAFRIREDYAGAIDTTTCLLVRILGTGINAVVDLRKNDGGTEASLKTGAFTNVNGTDYLLWIFFVGSYIRVWGDGVEVISHELLGTDLKYRDYPRVGIRLDKAGSPGTAARADSYYAYHVTPGAVVSEDEPQANSLAIRLPAQGGRAYTDSTILMVEGQGRLTEMAADTTFEALASDTSAVLEIQTGDPAFQLLLDTARYLLYEHAAQPGNTADAEERTEYQRQAEIARAAMGDSTKLEMPQPAVRFKFPD